jgi:hypothetical protein
VVTYALLLLLLLQDEMAHAGYRTLLVGQRELSRQEYEQWEAAYSAAQVRSGTLHTSQLEGQLLAGCAAWRTAIWWRQQCSSAGASSTRHDSAS